MSANIRLETKGYVNKYLSDCTKVLGLLEDENLVKASGSCSLSHFLDDFFNKYDSCEFMLSELNLIGNVNILDVQVQYVDVRFVSNPIKYRPCSDLFHVFEQDEAFDDIIQMFADDKDLMEIFNDIPSPTFAMVATYRVIFDALFYEQLQQKGVSNKELFLYLIAIILRYPSCLSPICPDSFSSDVNPRIPLIGVLISWLIFCKKAVFNRSLSSAFFKAATNSSSVFFRLIDKLIWSETNSSILTSALSKAFSSV